MGLPSSSWLPPGRTKAFRAAAPTAPPRQRSGRSPGRGPTNSRIGRSGQDQRAEPWPGRHADVRRAVPVQRGRRRSQKADHCDGTGENAVVLLPGSTLTMTADSYVFVPAGTTVTSPNGNTVVINGSENKVYTEAGATVSVPSNATGPATNLVCTGHPVIFSRAFTQPVFMTIHPPSAQRREKT